MDYSQLRLHVLEIFAEAQQRVTDYQFVKLEQIGNERRVEKNAYEVERRRFKRARLRALRPPKPIVPPKARFTGFAYLLPAVPAAALGCLPELVSCARCRNGLTSADANTLRSHETTCRPIRFALVQEPARDWSGKLPVVVSCVHCRQGLTAGSAGVLRAHLSNCRRRH